MKILDHEGGREGERERDWFVNGRKEEVRIEGIKGSHKCIIYLCR